MLYNTLLLCSDHCKYLGVTLQSDLKWDRYIKEKIANANSTLGLLQRNIKVSSVHTKELAYKALVRPKSEYACKSGHPGSNILLRKFKGVLLNMCVTITIVPTV